MDINNFFSNYNGESDLDCGSDLYSVPSNMNYIDTYDIPKEEKKEDKKDKYTEEEIDELKKEMIPVKKNKLSGLSSFFYFNDIKKSEDVIPSTPLEYIKINSNNVITFDLNTTDPNRCGRRLYRRKTMWVYPNTVTSLIGCNGSGKTTMLNTIHGIIELKRNNAFPILSYDNLHDGGHNSIEHFAFNNDFETMASLITSSEGETILQNVYPVLDITEKIIKGNYKRNPSGKLYRYPDHIFLLLDALDSGFSIDNIYNIKLKLFDLLKLAKENNKYLYIISASNSFEMVIRCNCWDVQSSDYMHFDDTDYIKYRNHISKTRAKILKQWENLRKKNSEE